MYVKLHVYMNHFHMVTVHRSLIDRLHPLPTPIDLPTFDFTIVQFS